MVEIQKSVDSQLGTINDIRSQIGNLQTALKDGSGKATETEKRGKGNSGKLNSTYEQRLRDMQATLENIKTKIDNNTATLNRIKSAKNMDDHQDPKAYRPPVTDSGSQMKADSKQTRTQPYQEVENEFSYPAPVSECIAHLHSINADIEIIKPEPLREGIFTRTTEGIFLMVGDARRPGQRYFVFPKVDFFSTKQDYFTYYQNYYDCENPSGGDVWVIKPAAVEDGNFGELKLTEKGLLRVES
ncbi:MAG TPA: hypothetical protein VJX74_14530 [Blastocatellia bacterium]|nr:hypothetical protein [Blastocatellia bacterium]